ncbi:MAG: TatD family hydrolase [Ruminococcaceae bacterium]|nr:TatD family hydrolase [Oscillospiraceae bacterium]
MIEGIIDTHAHYDDEKFDFIRHATLSSLEALGVRGIVNCSSSVESSYFSVELSQIYDFVFAAVGVHPHDADNLSDGWRDSLEDLLKTPKVVAVGETGLDYFYDNSPREIQLEVFYEQIRLSLNHSLPLVVHDRDAHEDILKALEIFKPKAVVHRYSGDAELARKLTDLGVYLGFGCAVTYPDSKNEIESVKSIPIEYLLLETDAPYLPPYNLRGRICTSDMISVAAEKIAEIRGDYSPKQIVDIAAENACRLFNF